MPRLPVGQPKARLCRPKQVRAGERRRRALRRAETLLGFELAHALFGGLCWGWVEERAGLVSTQPQCETHSGVFDDNPELRAIAPLAARGAHLPQRQNPLTKSIAM
jgi:hypothetical protein